MNDTIINMNKEVLKYLLKLNYSVETINTVFVYSDIVPDIYEKMNSTLGEEGIEASVRDLIDSLLNPDYGTNSNTM